MKNYYKTLNINESTICSGDNQKCKFEPRHCCLLHLPIHKHKNTQTNKQTNKHIELEQVQVMRSNAIFAMRDEKDLIDTI